MFLSSFLLVQQSLSCRRRQQVLICWFCARVKAAMQTGVLVGCAVARLERLGNSPAWKFFKIIEGEGASAKKRTN